MAGRVFQHGSEQRQRYAWRPPIEPPFLMPIDSVRDSGVPGEVAAAGRVLRGKLYPGELLRVLGDAQARVVVVAAIEVDGDARDQAVSGDTAVLVLRGARAGELRAGRALAAPRYRPAPPPLPAFGAELYLAKQGDRADGPWRPIVAHS